MKSKELIKNILSYLENRLQENPTLDELEETFHYSKF